MTDAPDASDEQRQIADALREIRREGYKLAFVYATVDAAAVAVGTALVVGVLGVGGDVSLPAVGSVGLPRIAAALTGSLAFVAEFAYRVRMPIVDRFEAANPPVRETLRTARDTVARGDDNMMARRLYAEAADRLREASSVKLLDTRRLGATIALTLLLGVASVHALGAGVQLFGAGPSTGPAGSGGAAEYEGLRSADEVLGEETNVSELDEDLDATVGTSGGGDEETNRTISRRSYGGGTAGSFDAARAGFEETESVEDAALIREYNLRIRGETS